MEIESLIAIILSVIAIVGCVSVYMVIPELDDNPVTWGAITQYSDDIENIQEDIVDMKMDIKDSDFGYNNVVMNDMRDDIDDIEEDVDDIINCLEDFNESDGTAFEYCINRKF